MVRVKTDGKSIRPLRAISAGGKPHAVQDKAVRVGSFIPVKRTGMSHR